MTRTFVMGDPQAPFAKILEVLAHHGALAGDHLADDVVLVSIGDHFDYDPDDPATASDNGLRTLRWLAAHDPAQVHLLLGNHDIARVMELAPLSDERFAAARTFARALAGDVAARARFAAAFPELPTPGVAGRDYASFTTAQRQLVIELLLAGRFHLALTGALLDGRAALLTHAGVTERERALLGTTAEPRALAAALEAALAAAVASVRADWSAGGSAPLDLAPLHVAGVTGAEGGGLLYHRPTNPARDAVDRSHERHPDRPRRFHPDALPLALTQIAGHSGHNKCLYELGPWATPAARARAHGGIRTLRVAPPSITYDLGVLAPAPGVADLILIDGELRRVPAHEVALLPLAHLDAP